MIRDLIPARWRQVLYVALGVASAAQAAFEVVDSGVWSRVLMFASMLGFGLAAGNTGAPKEAGGGDA